MAKSKPQQKATTNGKNKWVVKYGLWGSKKPIIRRFPNEKKARAYYVKLFKRSDPPSNQGIEEEKAT